MNCWMACIEVWTGKTWVESLSVVLNHRLYRWSLCQSANFEFGVPLFLEIKHPHIGADGWQQHMNQLRVPVSISLLGVVAWLFRTTRACFVGTPIWITSPVTLEVKCKEMMFSHWMGFVTEVVPHIIHQIWRQERRFPAGALEPAHVNGLLGFSMPDS